MGDFYQNGIITTLHNLAGRSLEELESDLVAFSKVRSMALVLPSLLSLPAERGSLVGHVVDLMRTLYIPNTIAQSQLYHGKSYSRVCHVLAYTTHRYGGGGDLHARGDTNVLLLLASPETRAT